MNTQLLTLRIVWFAILATIPMVAAVASFTTPSDAPPDTVLVYGVMLAAMGPAAVALAVGPGRFVNPVPDYRTTAILRFALSESVGLTGFILHFLGADLIFPLALYGLSILLLLINAPKASGFDAK